MQEYEDRRKVKQEEYAAQRSRRVELRNSKLILNILFKATRAKLTYCNLHFKDNCLLLVLLIVWLT